MTFQRFLRLERPRLRGGRINVIPSGQLGLDLRRDFGGRDAFFTLR